MKVLAMSLLLIVGTVYGQSTFTLTETRPRVGHRQSIQPLTEPEKKALHDAEGKVAQAQKELDAVTLKIQYAHGHSPARLGRCDPSETLVTFWGDYALIEVNPLDVCRPTW